MLSPLITVLVLWAAWSGFWYFLSSTAQNMAADWREKAAARGMTLDCQNETWGGYPFRIEIRCEQFKFTRSREDRETEIRSGSVTAVAQVYKPWHVILELAPPLNISLPANKADAAKLVLFAEHEPGLASIRLDDNYKPHVSLLLKKLKGDAEIEAGEGELPAGKFEADSLNVHFRFDAASTPVRPAAAVAATIEALDYDGPVRDPVDGGPIKFDKVLFDGSLSGLPTKRSPTLTDLLRKLADNDANLQIRQFSAVKGPVVLQTNGDISLDKAGLLNGKVNARVERLDHVIDRMEEAGRLSKNDARVSKGLFKIMSEDKPNGEIVSDFTLKESKLYFGPFRLMKLRPLF